MPIAAVLPNCVVGSASDPGATGDKRMYYSQIPVVELYDALLAYEGADCYSDLLEPWILCHRAEADWLLKIKQRWSHRPNPADPEELSRLYAWFRVTSLLLLRFQKDHSGRSSYDGPAITPFAFQLFHEQMGFSRPDVGVFHPFFHEVLSVSPTSTEEPRLEIARQDWPCLMLGRMLFLRAGCHVVADLKQFDKAIAESSMLYWTYRRRDRRCTDQSQGWGGNSQWRTAFRRDFHFGGYYEFNIDGQTSLDGKSGHVGGVPIDTMIELVRHRCLVRSTLDDSDLFPYPYRHTEPE